MSANSTRYRGKAGQWAFLGHRITGFLVFLFLLLHIVDVSLLRWPETYDQVHRLYGNVLLRLFEVGLLFALLFHTFNGVRIVAVDVFPEAVRNQRRLLQVVVALTLLAGVPGGLVILWPFIDGRIL
ncbi:MAG TPA: succinate dehydrogenase, cytochrome b556 subunit [Acidimicrobiales bacterium]|nr:succinate dehydrogenase, cytochrome b556 subunit [Acidimicrobiales bacterium]